MEATFKIPAAPFQHPGQQQGGQPRQRRHVDLDHLQLPPDADPGDRTAGPEAGVVHQHVHVDIPLRQRLHDLVRTAGPAQVSGHHLHRDPGFRGELAGQLPQRVLAAGDEHQVRAIAGEEPSAG